MDTEDLAAELRSFLVEVFAAEPRRSWGLDAFYHRGRLFVLFDGGDLVGKWPPKTRARLHATTGARAFMGDTDASDASWLRISLDRLDLDEAITLSLEAAEFVHTPEGAPQGRRSKASVRLPTDDRS